MTITVDPALPPAFDSLPSNQTISCSEVDSVLLAISALGYSNGESDSCEISGQVNPQLLRSMMHVEV